MKGMGGRKSSPLYEGKNNKNLNKAPQVNNNNKTLAPGSPLHMVVHFGFERRRKQAALRKNMREKRKTLLSSPDSAPQTRPRAELHRPQRKTVAASAARLAAPRAPAPSLKRGRGGPAGRAGGRADRRTAGRRGAHTPDPAEARTVHCKQARGTEPLGGGGGAAAQSPVSGVRPRTATAGSHTRTHTHARTSAFTRIHTLPHTCRDRRIFTLAVDYCGVVGG